MKTIITLDRANQPYGYPQLNDERGIEVASVNTEVIMSPKVSTSDITIPADYNAIMLGPVAVSGTIDVGVSSSLVVVNF